MTLKSQYQFMLENVRAAIVLHTATTQIIYANRMATELLGVTLEQMMGAIDADDRWRLIGEDGGELPVSKYPVNLAIAARDVVNDILVGIHRASDGKFVWLLCSAYPVFDDNANLDRVVVSFIDVTGRKLAEANLRESEERYRLLAENANDLIVCYSRDARVVYASPSFRRYGYEPDELVGRGVGCMVKADYQESVLQSFRDALAGSTVESEAWPASAADGRAVWLEGRLAPFYDASGEISGVLAAIRDVSERVEAEAALGEVNAELVRVTRISTLGVFTASLAHEVNQPLAALAANAEAASLWLKHDPPDLDQAKQAIKRAGQDARRASDIISRLRAIVTRETVKVADFDLNDAIREIMSLTEIEQRRSNVKVKLELAKGPLPVRGDRIQIQQVIMNLVINALEAMVDTPIEGRRLKVRTVTAGDGKVRIEVADRGPGIDPAAADRIFDQLFTTKSGGTGLGLAISKSIVEAHGGRIWAQPAKPHGAVFCLEIPTFCGEDASQLPGDAASYAER